jgi:D-arabinose 1-dehydrogenase-like Zn-dependent alcohol dehydrogenase
VPGHQIAGVVDALGEGVVPLALAAIAPGGGVVCGAST